MGKVGFGTITADRSDDGLHSSSMANNLRAGCVLGADDVISVNSSRREIVDVLTHVKQAGMNMVRPRNDGVREPRLLGCV